MWFRVRGFHRVLIGVTICLVGACTGTPVDPSGANSIPTTPISGDPTSADPTTQSTMAAPPPTVPRPPAAPLPGLADLSDQPLPDSIERSRGQLPNGFTYAVKHNEKPTGEVNLRLVVRAGSAHELTPKTGVAHFLQHMMFNGTEKYPRDELIGILQGFDTDFGEDVNGHTYYTSTVYSLTTPNDDASVDVALDVLHQWLTAATIPDEEVVRERGVILDEWRVRTQSASGRQTQAAKNLFLAGSPFAGRDPIGLPDDVGSMDVATLRGFYDAWYRPDNVGVIVVGDIDEAQVAKKIESKFEPAVARGQATSEIDAYQFPLTTAPLFALQSDAEQRNVDIEVTLPLPAIPEGGTLAMRARVHDRLIYNILIQRLEYDLGSGTAPFDEVRHAGNSFVEPLDAPAVYATTTAERARPTLQALLDEFERTFRFGFSDQEVALASQKYVAEIDSLSAAGDVRQGSEFADELAGADAAGTTAPSLGDWGAAMKAETSLVTTQSLWNRFQARWTNSAPGVVISAPADVAESMPNDAEVVQIVASSRAAQVAPRPERPPAPTSLMDRPAPVAAVDVKPLTGELGAEFEYAEYTYPNGVRVITNDHVIEPGKLYLSGQRPGGLALVPDPDVIDARYAAEVAVKSGVANFNVADLADIKASRVASVTPFFDVHEVGFRGNADASALELQLQLLHLYLTNPRFDQVALDQVVRQHLPVIDDPAIDPFAAGWNAFTVARHGDQLRYRYIPTRDEFATLDLEGARRVWASRMSNAAGWTFEFAGDLPENFNELIDAYLGTLPVTGKLEQPGDVSGTPPPGVVRQHVTAGEGGSGSLLLAWDTRIPAQDMQLRVEGEFTAEILNNRLAEAIRTQFGDSYTQQTVVRMDYDYWPTVEVQITATCAPERLDELSAIIDGQLRDLANVPVSDAEFQRARASLQQASQYVNSAGILRDAEIYSKQPGYDLNAYFWRADLLPSISPDTITRFVATYVSPDHYIAITTSP